MRKYRSIFFFALKGLTLPTKVITPTRQQMCRAGLGARTAAARESPWRSHAHQASHPSSHRSARPGRIGAHRRHRRRSGPDLGTDDALSRPRHCDALSRPHALSRLTRTRDVAGLIGLAFATLAVRFAGRVISVLLFRRSCRPRRGATGPSVFSESCRLKARRMRRRPRSLPKIGPSSSYQASTRAQSQ